jgi:hypothetical protein
MTSDSILSVSDLIFIEISPQLPVDDQSFVALGWVKKKAVKVCADSFT